MSNRSSRPRATPQSRRQDHNPTYPPHQHVVLLSRPHGLRHPDIGPARSSRAVPQPAALALARLARLQPHPGRRSRAAPPRGLGAQARLQRGLVLPALACRGCQRHVRCSSSNLPAKEDGGKRPMGSETSGAGVTGTRPSKEGRQRWASQQCLAPASPRPPSVALWVWSSPVVALLLSVASECPTC